MIQWQYFWCIWPPIRWVAFSRNTEKSLSKNKEKEKTTSGCQYIQQVQSWDSFGLEAKFNILKQLVVFFVDHVRRSESVRVNFRWKVNVHFKQLPSAQGFISHSLLKYYFGLKIKKFRQGRWVTEYKHLCNSSLKDYYYHYYLRIHMVAVHHWGSSDSKSSQNSR